MVFVYFWRWTQILREKLSSFIGSDQDFMKFWFLDPPLGSFWFPLGSPGVPLGPLGFSWGSGDLYPGLELFIPPTECVALYRRNLYKKEMSPCGPYWIRWDPMGPLGTYGYHWGNQRNSLGNLMGTTCGVIEILPMSPRGPWGSQATNPM